MHAQESARPESVGAKPWTTRPGLGSIVQFGGDRSGVSTVEFAITSVPFLGMIFAVIETMLILLSTGVMDNAVETASRRIYTGQFQQDNASTATANLAANFKKEFCNRYWGLNSCANVKIDVRAYDTFPKEIPSPIIRDASGKTVVDPGFGQFTKPQRNQIVIVRAAVENPVFLSLLNPNQTNLSSGKRLIVGTFSFRSEPF